MQWSPQQERALDNVGRWLKSGGEQVFHLFGYAGTGKTTLAKHLAEQMNGNVMFGAFTGKAASVLHEKGCLGAQTIHSMIYHSREKGKAQLVDMEKQLAALEAELGGEGLSSTQVAAHKRVIDLKKLIEEEREALKEPFFVLNRESDVRNADLIVIDECSMVDGKMGADLLSFGKKVLVLGDPAQLPPVKGQGYFTEGVNPDVMLDEIHRQAEESPIIRMATQIRNEQPLALGDYGEGCRVVDEGVVKAKEAMTFDQILVGKNATRFATNRRMRELLGRSGPLPEPGDKIVCRRNDNDMGLLNGVLYEVVAVHGHMDAKVNMDVRPVGQPFSTDVMAHEQSFISSKDDIPYYELRDAQVFEYGYAVTVHVAQGSQWDKVLMFDESYCFRKDKWRWLYTGITRAAKEVTVVRT